jgi:VIT1/CCC1 family predicted Fe2+/Mn2+ transporter
MKAEQRQERVFGIWDGTVSITGLIFGLLLHHSPESAIAVGGLGAAVSACVSMGTGEYEKGNGPWRERLAVAGTMLVATLIGSLVPIWPFFFFAKAPALFIAAWGCAAVAGWIGWTKRRGLAGYVSVYLTLLLAVALTLAVVSLIPQSA